MKFLSWLKSRFTWKWVGKVEGPANSRCLWFLYERGDGKRKVVRVGRWSHQARRSEAQVEAWQRGGPVPMLVPEFKPKASRPALVLLQGGKAAR